MVDGQRGDAMSEENPPHAAAAPRWQPLSAIDRRVLGVLVEKAKTTPDAYPMSLNALVSGCNQKSNRFPLMRLEAHDVEASLERLREQGAVAEVHSGGRVPRYRHYAYEWLGVDKTELAVMAELLLRGAQTEGELRGRASRMEPIADLNALRPVLQSLKEKRLVISVTPEGRGHVVSHALYQPHELDRLRAEYGPQRAAATGAEGGAAEPRGVNRPDDVLDQPGPSRPAFGQPARPQPGPQDAPPERAAAAQLPPAAEQELAQLRAEVEQLRSDLNDLVADFQNARADIDRLRDQIGGY